MRGAVVQGAITIATFLVLVGFFRWALQSLNEIGWTG